MHRIHSCLSSAPTARPATSHCARLRLLWRLLWPFPRLRCRVPPGPWPSWHPRSSSGAWARLVRIPRARRLLCWRRSTPPQWRTPSVARRSGLSSTTSSAVGICSPPQSPSRCLASPRRTNFSLPRHCSARARSTFSRGANHRAVASAQGVARCDLISVHRLGAHLPFAQRRCSSASICLLLIWRCRQHQRRHFVARYGASPTGPCFTGPF
jgi:hypothetical protein